MEDSQTESYKGRVIAWLWSQIKDLDIKNATPSELDFAIRAAGLIIQDYWN